jgi:ceroid-lipofuscinosis MFS transporter 7
MAGDFLYFTARSPTTVLAGRLVAGVGMGGGSSIYTMLAWTSHERDRTSSLSLAVATRNVGIVLGPALNLFLYHLNFDLGPYRVYGHNASGFLMSILWTLNFFMVIIMYFDPSRDTIAALDEETKPLTGSKNYGVQNGCHSNGTYRPLTIQEKGWNGFYETVKHYVREEIVALLAVQLFLFFNQCALEGFIPPFTKDHFGWDVFEISLFFCGAAFTILVVFLLLHYFKTTVADRAVVLAGLLINICGTGILLGFLPRMTSDYEVTKNVAIFVLGSGLNMLGYPCVLLASTGLLSKLTAMSHQGRTQGIRRVVSNTGMIMGPLWSGALMDSLYIMLSVMVALWLLVALMQGVSFKTLRDPGAARRVVE